MNTAARAALRFPLVAGLCALFMLVGITPVFADSPSSGGDMAVAQTLGSRELTVVLRRVTSVPGPLRVDVVAHAGSPAGRLTVEVTPTGAATGSSSLPAPGGPTDRGNVDLAVTPGMYSTTVAVDRPGPWELTVGDGQHVTQIPFVVPIPATSPPEQLVYGGFLAAGVLLLVSFVVAVRARRSGWALLPAGGMLVGVSVAVTAAVLSASLPLPPQPGNQLDPTVNNVTNPYALNPPLISDFSRPPVMLALDGEPVTAGRPTDIGVNLTDGATGAPVDDLLDNDSALIHLLVVGPAGQLWHVHPIRIAPGRYQVQLTLPQSGHYAVSAEVERRGGGVQMVRAAAGLDVLPASSAVAAPNVQPNTAGSPLRLGNGPTSASTVVDATPITVTTTTPIAGKPTTITAKVGDTADLQPWLSMIGHMIVAGPLPANSGAPIGAAVQGAPLWAHAHSMGGAMPMAGMPMTGMTGMPMPGMTGMPVTGTSGTANAGSGMSGMIMAPVNGDSPPDETVAAYGPDVPFTFTFPIAGQYRLWIQAERQNTLLTVPVVLDVAAAPVKGAQR
jgi:hypothetical protein